MAPQNPSSGFSFNVMANAKSRRGIQFKKVSARLGASDIPDERILGNSAHHPHAVNPIVPEVYMIRVCYLHSVFLLLSNPIWIDVIEGNWLTSQREKPKQTCVDQGSSATWNSPFAVLFHSFESWGLKQNWCAVRSRKVTKIVCVDLAKEKGWPYLAWWLSLLFLQTHQRRRQTFFLAVALSIWNKLVLFQRWTTCASVCCRVHVLKAQSFHEAVRYSAPRPVVQIQCQTLCDLAN